MGDGRWEQNLMNSIDRLDGKFSTDRLQTFRQVILK